jgi:cytochrome oxidase assembly protein ShyY1
VYRFVFSWRWIRLHVLIWLVLIPSFIGLGMWQRSRYHAREAENRIISAAMHAAPVDLAGVDSVGQTIPQADRWKQVTVSGAYDAAHQFLARNHQENGNPGFWVITPLVAPDGTAVLVNRGWIPTLDSDPQATPPIPAPPSGTVDLTGRLQMSETRGNTGIRDVTSGLPAGQISLVNTESLAAKTGLRLRGGYVERITSRPADAAGLTAMDEPSLDSGPYLSYWFQWWLFALMAVGGWVTIIRREAQHRIAEAAERNAENEEDEDEADDGGPDASDPDTTDADGKVAGAEVAPVAESAV